VKGKKVFSLFCYIYGFYLSYKVFLFRSTG